jgi:hypothetical protein
MSNRLIGVALSLHLIVLGSQASAQVPAARTPNKIYTRSKIFCLPVALDDKERDTLGEVQLYVKQGPNEPWVLKDTASPTRSEFDYRVTQDGEYWFTIATLEKNRQPVAIDTSHMTPGIIVVVDTQAPEISLRSLPPRPQGTLVECKVQDANPDPSRLRVEYQTTDKSWQLLEAVPGEPTMFRVPSTALPDALVRATATDRAGNTATRLLNLGGETTATEASSEAGALNMLASHSDKVPGPPPAQTGSSAARQLLAGTRLTADYRIERQGPTGVSKIEVWVTRDEGLTWQRVCEDKKPSNSIAFDLPGEGVYGICLVATNGSGISAKPPSKGEAPDYWVEVDMTKPAAQLLAVRPGVGDEAGNLYISWAASDKNMGATPIDLYYATQRTGPWLPIGHGLKNDGTFRWPLPPEAGPEFYIRMDVTDQAGNMTRCELQEAVVVDLVRPKARVLSVKAGNSRLSPPLGN